jgi:hypothetical protein
MGNAIRAAAISRNEGSIFVVSRPFRRIFREDPVGKYLGLQGIGNSKTQDADFNMARRAYRNSSIIGLGPLATLSVGIPDPLEMRTS